MKQSNHLVSIGMNFEKVPIRARRSRGKDDWTAVAESEAILPLCLNISQNIFLPKHTLVQEYWFTW